MRRTVLERWGQGEGIGSSGDGVGAVEHEENGRVLVALSEAGEGGLIDEFNGGRVDGAGVEAMGVGEGFQETIKANERMRPQKRRGGGHGAGIKRSRVGRRWRWRRKARRSNGIQNET